MTLAFIHNGLPQHSNCLRDYGRFIDKDVYFPEMTEADLDGCKAAVIACRSDNDLLFQHAGTLRAFLDHGGILAIMGGMRADIVDPNITFIETGGTNFTWFMQENPDSGHRLRSPDHGLHNFIGLKDMQWHRHGYYMKPDRAETIVELCQPHSDVRVGDILFEDRSSFRGRLIATTLDPHFHHGGHYIPSTTRFLNGFYPWLRQEIGSPVFA